MTFRMRWRLYGRGLRLLSQALPSFFGVMTAHTLVVAVTPYVTVYLLSRLFDELTSTRESQALWLWAGLAVGVQALSALVGGVLRRIKEAKWENVYRAADRIVLDTLLDMEHAVLCDPATRHRLSQVRENAAALGRGLVRIPDVTQNLLYGMFGAFGAATVTWLWLMSGGARVLLLCAALLVTVLGSLWLHRRAHRAVKADTAEVVALDRRYYAFYNAVFDPQKAADMRLYEQDALLSARLQEAENTSFAKDGLKRLPLYGGGIFRALSTVLSVFWLFCVLCFAAQGTLHGTLSVGGAVCLIGALPRLLEDLGHIGRGVSRLRENTPYLQTVLAFLDTPHRLYQGTLTTEKRTDRDYEVEFRHVSFCYPGQQAEALSDVSVTLRVGSRIAIVGKNGSGKSTFVKLLCRLYEPDEGEILLNGIDIRKYDYTEYIALIAAVFQDFQLLSGTLGENVAGVKEYDSACVLHCLENAGFAQRLYEWNGGLQTPLDEEMLSAADASRIAVARALYKDAPLLILDEPTAMLDPVAEAALYAGLDRIVGDRTAVYISHRLASCRFCDEILVFDGGRIVERGTHKELVALSASKYHALWQAQAQYYS